MPGAPFGMKLADASPRMSEWGESVVFGRNPFLTPLEPQSRFGGKPLKTRSTIEVGHFRYFVSEKRGPLTPILTSKKKRFIDSGHGILRRNAF